MHYIYAMQRYILIVSFCLHTVPVLKGPTNGLGESSASPQHFSDIPTQVISKQKTINNHHYLERERVQNNVGEFEPTGQTS